MNKMFNFIGYVTFSAIGAYTEDFLTELIKNGIDVSNIHNMKNIVYADIKRSNYLYMARLAKKFRVRTKVIKRHGLYFKIKRMSHHSGIIFGTIVSIILVMILQQYIWKIEIKGGDNTSENHILEIIENNGVGLGAYTGNIDTDELALKIKHTLKDTGWVGVEKIGSKLRVSLSESEIPKKSYLSPKTPCNVIASHTGVIVETEVYSGELLYPIGSGVSEGNIIVSGTINDGADNIILSHANAKIIAEFKDKVEFRQEYTTVEYQKKGDYSEEKELMIFGFVFPITEKIKNSRNCFCDEKIEVFRFMNISLPFSVKTNRYTPYEEITVTRKATDAEKLVEQKFDIYCNNFYDDYEIINVERTIKRDEYGVTLIADVTLKGNIAVQQEIMERSQNIIDR